MKIQDLNDFFERRVIPDSDNSENSLYDLDVNVDWIELEEQNQTAITALKICSGGCLKPSKGNNQCETEKCQTQTCKNCKVPYL